jgi:hypothetical protein
MWTAIIGLAGILLGVVGTGIWQMRLERRRERRALRLATRLLNDEIRWALLRVYVMQRLNNWSGTLTGDVMVMWGEHRAVLAENLKLGEWSDVRSAVRQYASAQPRVNDRRAQSKLIGEPVTPLPREDVTLTKLREELGKAEVALARYMRDDDLAVLRWWRQRRRRLGRAAQAQQAGAAARRPASAEDDADAS